MGGSFTPEEFLYISMNISIFNTIQNFIETGTHYGNTTRLASVIFKKVFTFEINKIFYEFSKRKLESLGCNNVKYYLGDSVKLLNSLLDDIVDPSFFFLDAHHHGVNAINVNMDNGSDKTPLIEELNIINNKYPNIKGIICIDDVRLWRSDNKDWSNVSDEIIMNSLNNHKITDSFEYKDRLYIIIN